MRQHGDWVKRSRVCISVIALCSLMLTSSCGIQQGLQAPQSLLPSVSFEVHNTDGGARIDVLVASPSQNEVSALAIRCGALSVGASRVSAVRLEGSNGFAVLGSSFDSPSGRLSFVVANPLRGIRGGLVLSVECETTALGEPEVEIDATGIELVDSHGKRIEALTACVHP